MWDKIFALAFTALLLIIGLTIALALCYAVEDPPMEEMYIVRETETD